MTLHMVKLGKIHNEYARPKQGANDLPNSIQHIDPINHNVSADQSEHSVLFRRRGFIEN